MGDIDMRPIIAALAALSLTACAGGGRSALATTYGKMHLFGGYSDEEIEPGVWKVTGAGNGPAGPGFGRNVALYRAAEIVKAHGFSHIQVLKQSRRARRLDELCRREYGPDRARHQRSRGPDRLPGEARRGMPHPARGRGDGDDRPAADLPQRPGSQAMTGIVAPRA
jgi:hypothetical protein